MKQKYQIFQIKRIYVNYPQNFVVGMKYPTATESCFKPLTTHNTPEEADAERQKYDNPSWFIIVPVY